MPAPANRQGALLNVGSLQISDNAALLTIPAFLFVSCEKNSVSPVDESRFLSSSELRNLTINLAGYDSVRIVHKKGTTLTSRNISAIGVGSKGSAGYTELSRTPSHYDESSDSYTTTFAVCRQPAGVHVLSMNTTLARIFVVASFVPALLMLSCEKIVSPKEYSIQKPDTTSHNIFWQVDSLSANGMLYDVAIVNDSLLYAVGELHPFDSTGQFSSGYYSLAQWDGSTWHFRRLYYLCSDCLPAGPLPLTSVEGIQAFSPTDIWLCIGSIFHWNGADSVTELSFSRLNLANPVGMIDRLWGSSSNNLYGVGEGGSVVHFNGSEWQQIDAGTMWDFRDIHGSGNEILAVARNRNVADESRIISFQGTTVIMSDSSVSDYLTGIWFSPGEQYLVVGAGIYSKTSLRRSAWKRTTLDLTNTYNLAVAGTGANNVFVGGWQFSLLHYNGSTWRSYPEFRSVYGGLQALDVKQGMIIGVGSMNSRAVVIRGVQ